MAPVLDERSRRRVPAESLAIRYGGTRWSHRATDLAGRGFARTSGIRSWTRAARSVGAAGFARARRSRARPCRPSNQWHLPTRVPEELPLGSRLWL